MGAGGGVIHEVGCVRMGDDPKTSVLNAFCRAHHVPNLFVADGGPFVSHADKNPTHTIIALAWRTAEYLADGAEEGQCLRSRDVTRSAAGPAFAAAGAIDTVDAREAHLAVQQAAAAAGGKYAPKALSAHSSRTLERLTDLIVPVDNGKPGALAGRVAAVDRHAAQRERRSEGEVRDRPGLARHDDRRRDGATRLRQRDAGAADRAARRDRLQEEPDAGERRRASTSSCWRGA